MFKKKNANRNLKLNSVLLDYIIIYINYCYHFTTQKNNNNPNMKRSRERREEEKKVLNQATLRNKKNQHKI